MTARIVAMIALVLSTLVCGCIKVNHIGDRTGKAFDNVFYAQTRVAPKGSVWEHKAMESELANGAVKTMQANEQSGNTTSIGVPLMSMPTK